MANHPNRNKGGRRKPAIPLAAAELREGEIIITIAFAHAGRRCDISHYDTLAMIQSSRHPQFRIQQSAKALADRAFGQMVAENIVQDPRRPPAPPEGVPAPANRNPPADG